MSGRLKRLGRLLAMRRLSEDLDRRSLQNALASVAEVDVALGRQAIAVADALAAARIALADGNRSELLMTEAQREVAGWNRKRLNIILDERTAIVPRVMTRFLESRREHEQVKQLVEDSKLAALIDADRKAQAAADDWYLSKRTRDAMKSKKYS